MQDQDRNLGVLEWLWVLTIVGFVFAGSSPGQPQPADYAALVLMLIGLLGYRGPLPDYLRPIAMWTFVFFGYVTACNLVWFAISDGELSLLSTVLRYAFNFVIGVGWMVHVGNRGERMIRATYYGFAATVVSMTVLSFVHPGEHSTRLTLYFENPNQAAYHMLASVAIALILGERYGLHRSLVIVLLACAAYIEMKTYSRAGVLGIVLLIALQFMRRPLLVMAVAAPILLAALSFDAQVEIDDPLWENRIEDVQDSDLSGYVTDRGLERIIKHPSYLLLGAGEGWHKRFNVLGMELHSTAATLLFSFGIVGTLAFAGMVMSVVRVAGPVALSYLLPVFLYSMFHQGLRARPFWLVFAVLAATSAIDNARKDCT